MHKSKLPFKLGDRVEYTHVSRIHRASIGMHRTESKRIPIPLPSPKTGVIVGYRSMPVGVTVTSEGGYPEFKSDRCIGCYMVAYDINRKPVYVQEKYLSFATETPSRDIISPYQCILVGVNKVITYRNFGYIYRVEEIRSGMGTEADTTMEMKVCYSLDGLYIGDNKTVNRLCRDIGIREFYKTSTTDSVVSIGFNPATQKWYGWSHRAIHGFGIGSSVIKGDCAYVPVDKRDMLEDMMSFWDVGVRRKCETRDKHCISNMLSYTFDTYSSDDASNCSSLGDSDDSNRQGIELIIETVFDFDRPSYTSTYFEEYPKPWGRGEWTAVTLEDAREMATNFAEDVS